MARTKATAAKDSGGGPGKSHSDATKARRSGRRGAVPGEPTNRRRSHVSGGGGERDIHHTHEPVEKGKGKLRRSR
jgi:hypothetical protein